MNFLGYKRPDGKVGIRNHILILPTCACSSETCRVVASQLPQAVNVIVQDGCGEVRGNEEITQAVLSGFAANPNVYATVLIGLGCESNSVTAMEELIKSKTNKPLHTLIIQQEGGTINTINKAVSIAQKLVMDAPKCERELVDISELMLGIECGGSDTTSGLGSNPVIGNTSDRLVDLGGTSMMSETTEFIGAEHILAKRGATPEVSQQIIDICRDLEDHLSAAGQDLRTGQPTPGNKDGGLSTIEEKSLGCIYKGGTRPIVEVVKYAEAPTKKGSVIMDTPGYDIASVSAMIAGGCQVVVFTTGRGTPTGHAIAPVVKVTANNETYKNMFDNMDIDVSAVITGEKTINQMGEDVLNEIVEVANGKITKAEALGFNDIAINRICKYI